MNDPSKKSVPNNPKIQSINEYFKSDRSFHAVITNKSEFKVLLSKIGNIPFKERSIIATHIARIIGTNSKLLQDNGVFKGMIQIFKNLPQNSKEFQECVGSIMLKIREILIKNRKALNLMHKPMAEYSETIRDFLILIPAKPKLSFFNSLDQDIHDFIIGKLTPEQRESLLSNTELQETILDDDDEEDELVEETKMQRLIKMMFSDVMRLAPELVSAVILSLVTQLPHGNMIIDDKKTRKELMHKLNI